MHQPVSLESLTEEEKDRIAEDAKRSLIRGIGFFLAPFIIFGFSVWYINMHYERFGLEDADVRSWINVGLVFLAILPARLFVNVVLRYRKALNAWQKKVIRGKIASKNGKVVVVSGQKLKLSDEQAAKVNAGDEVIIAASTAGNFILSFDVLGNKNA